MGDKSLLMGEGCSMGSDLYKAQGTKKIKAYHDGSQYNVLLYGDCGNAFGSRVLEGSWENRTWGTLRFDNALVDIGNAINGEWC